MPHNLPRTDEVRLRHRVKAAREVLDYASTRTRADLDNDSMYRRAVTNGIQEVGEAAVKVSDVTRALAPSLPWRDIIGMRNRIVHQYFRLETEVLWTVIRDDLKPLIDTIERVLAGGVK